jgi:uncharacterized protein YbjT (DUF2867 family)
MILITGATGFVGHRLVTKLVAENQLQVRALVRDDAAGQRLAQNLPIEVVTGTLPDSDSLRPSLLGIHTVVHLAGSDMRGRHGNLIDKDVAGTKALVEAALEARVGRIIYVSRMGADKGSAFPLLRAKGEAEEAIKSSGLAYTIIRSSVLFGQNDHFSEHIAMLARAFPVFFVPGDGEATFQPLWVDDLVSCLAMSLEDLDLIDTTLSLGGPEILTYRRIVMRIMHASRSPRPIVGTPLLVNQAAAWFLDGLFARWPFTERWIELLAANQTAELGTIERRFGFRPASLDIGLIDKYMRHRRYAFEMMRFIFTQRW